MKIQPMSYKNYVWPFNPNQVEVTYSRNIQNLKLPLYGSVLQDLGCDKRVVTGSGAAAAWRNSTALRLSLPLEKAGCSACRGTPRFLLRSRR